MATPLAGVRVLDFTHGLAGPHCSMLLAELGADVVKLEPPNGDEMRTSAPLTRQGLSLHYSSHNRNKRSITLNLRDQRGRDLLHQLIPRFDVLVENYRPGVMERLGCGYAELTRYRPDLIMLSVSGFGQTGPYSQRAADDKVVQAMSGLMDLTGEVEGPPTKVGGSPSDYLAAIYGALAVTSGLLLRARTGQGQYIDLSLMDCMVTTLATQISQYMANGTVLRRTGNMYPEAAADGLYATADGHIYLSTGQDRQWANLCRAMAREDLVDRDGYRTRADRYARVDEVNGVISEWLGQRSTAAAMDALLRASVACGQVNTLAEMAADPQIRARELLFSVPSAAWGEVPGVNLPFQSEQLGSAAPAPPPEQGQHTCEVLEELLGLGRDQVERLKAAGVV
jgi:crotonobetainyl-CoA:carnitine CoA-transferase CaiB-like acyl-CoA transferase